MEGQVFKIHSDFYYVNFENKIYECKVREILKKQKEKIFVGDFVVFEIVDGLKGVITKLLSRKNLLTRPSVANVEQVVIISSIKEPDLDFEQLNRYIAFAKYHNIPTKLCFNKNDLSLDDSIIERVFKIYEPLGFEIVFTSALEKIGIDDFIEILDNKTTVFCGNSGVGKSSLINAISPNLSLRTKSVSEKTSRGTHTTRHCEIVEIKNKNNVIRIIDTPGFSNLKFDFLLPAQVGELFDEINQYKSGCKFSDCLHVRESDCHVIENLEKIDETRYKSYLSFVKEAQEYKEKVKNEGVKKETSQKESQNKKLAKISLKKRTTARNTYKQSLYKDIDY